MDLAKQITSNDKSIRNDTMVDLKEFKNQSLATQAKKGEQLVSMMPAIKKAFSLFHYCAMILLNYPQKMML